MSLNPVWIVLLCVLGCIILGFVHTKLTHAATGELKRLNEQEQFVTDVSIKMFRKILKYTTQGVSI